MLHDDARRDAFDFTSHFREDLYMCLTRRGDTLFELVDAMLCENGRLCCSIASGGESVAESFEPA
ncbi:hypothetical protein, partial [Streptomyces incanus]